MDTVSMLELRSRGRDIVRRLERGERLELTYRGRKVATLEPALFENTSPIPPNDSIFAFLEKAQSLDGLNNEQIDQALYGEGTDLR